MITSIEIGAIVTAIVGPLISVIAIFIKSHYDFKKIKAYKRKEIELAQSIIDSQRKFIAKQEAKLRNKAKNAIKKGDK